EVENYFVERAQDGREALERALSGSNAHHLFILDALLEHKSGFDVCRELRKNKRDTPVILLGGRQGVEDKIEALQSGADDFLSKRSWVLEEWMAKIEAWLRCHRRRRQVSNISPHSHMCALWLAPDTL